MDCDCDCWWLRVIRHLANGLGAEGPGNRRAFYDGALEFGKIIHRWCQVLTEAGSPMFGRGVVGVTLLKKRQADSHQCTTLNLTLDLRRVDGLAHVVSLIHCNDGDLTGHIVHLNFSYATRIGDCRVWRIVDLASFRISDGCRCG